MRRYLADEPLPLDCYFCWSQAIRWGAISLFGTIVMGAGLIVIVGRLLPFGEG